MTGSHKHQPIRTDDSDSESELDLNELDPQDGDLLKSIPADSTPLRPTPAPAGPSGQASSSSPAAAAAATGQGSQGTAEGLVNNLFAGTGVHRHTVTNTIDESVWDTLRRDLVSVWEKMRQVLWPKYLLGGLLTRQAGSSEAERGEAGSADGGDTGTGAIRQNLNKIVGRWPDAGAILEGGMSNGLRDWDLWGPLLFCLLLAFFLSQAAQESQRSLVFSGVFTIVWVGEAVVTTQIKLLGGNISFFQAMCIIGYTLFPLVIAAVLASVNVAFVIRLPVDIVLVLWSLAAGISILGGSGVLANKVGLAMFPLFIFYVALGCLCLMT